MEFRDFELRPIESFYLQRLRHVSQMGLLNLIYPDARHGRFEHSLGVLWSLKCLIGADREIHEKLKPEEIKALSFATLVHDAGHGPFSHTTETLLEVVGIDKIMRKAIKGEPRKTKPHERRTRDMIHDSDFLMPRMNVSSCELHQFMKREGVEATTVSSLILGTSPSDVIPQ